MPIYKEEKDKGQRQQLTVASLRSKYQRVIRRGQLQLTFKSIREAMKYMLMEPELPQQMPYPIYQPIAVPQLTPEQLQYIMRQYQPPLVAPSLQSKPAAIAPEVKPIQLEIEKGNLIPKPPTAEIYFQKENFVVYKKLIGEGSFSKVWEGVNLKTNQKIAAKQIKKLQDAESKCLKSLNSEYIIKIQTILKYKNFSFIILEFCDNNLREELAACDYELSKVLTYIEQIIYGMNEFMRQNFIHRDLKFENILVSKGVIKIADFGLAKYIGDELQVESRRCGTPYTMPPEVYFTRDNYLTPYTSKCDIWSMGVIFHEMLYQRHPFETKQDFKHRKRVLVKRKFGILDELIDRCLVFNPRERIDWKQVLEVYERYRKVKDRYMEVDAFPIEAESILYNESQPVIDDYHFNVCQYQTKKRNNQDYYMKLLNDYTKQPSYSKLVSKPEIKQIQQQQGLNCRKIGQPAKDVFTRKQGAIQQYPQWCNRNALHLQKQLQSQINSKNTNKSDLIVEAGYLHSKELFRNYRRKMQQIDEKVVVSNDREGARQLTETKTEKKQHKVIPVKTSGNGVQKQKIVTETAFIIICVIVIVYVSMNL